MSATPFTNFVAARTRAASLILSTAELLEGYLALGGLRKDLERIEQAGRTAEACNQTQGLAQNDGKSATREVRLALETLEGEYQQVLSVVHAVRGDLLAEQAADAVLTRLDSIVRNEAEGRGKRPTQEGLRAEIFRDASSLLDFEELAQRLADRRCDRPRLEKLKADAGALSGRLAQRAVAKGGSKASTQQEYDAVSAQNAGWTAALRLLTALAQQDARVEALLVGTSRPRRAARGG